MPQIPESELERYAREQAAEQDKANKLKVSMAYGVTQNPDNYSEATKMAERLKVQPNMLVDTATRKSMGESEAVTSFNPEDMIAKNPLLANWASNPDNAAIAHDDIPVLSDIETRIGAMPSFGQRLKQNYDNESFSFIPGLKSVKALAKTIADTPAVQDLNVNNGKTLGQVFRDARFLYDAVNNPLDRSPLQPDQNHGIIQAADKFAESAGWGNVAGIPLPPFVVKGLLRGGASELAGLTTLKNLGIMQGAGGLTQNSQALLNTYFGAEMIPGIAQSLKNAWDAPTPEDKVKSGVEALIGAYFTKQVVGGIGGGHPQINKSLTDLITAAEQSKLKARSPEKFHELLTTTAEGKDSLRIPVEEFETYFQSKNIDPAQVAQSIGAKNYVEAKLSGSDVEVSVPDFLGKLDAEHQKGLEPNVRLHEGAMTPREHEAWVKEGGPERLQQAIQEEVKKNADNPEFQQIRDEISKRLQDGQGMTKAVANSHAEIGAMQYMNAERAGMSPLEFFKAKNPTFTEGEAPSGSLGQPAFHGSPYRFDTVSDVATFYRETLPNLEGRGLDSTSNVPPSANEGLTDAVGVAAKNLSELLVSDTGEVKTFSSLDVEGGNSVLSVMRGVLKDGKVLDSVVRLIPVDVVNMLSGKKLASKGLLDNPSVLVDLLPSDANNLVPRAIEAIDKLAPAVTVAAAKVHAGLSGFDVFANDLATTSGTVHASNIPQPYTKGKGERGWFSVKPDGSFEIGKTPFGDASTPVHEALGHPSYFMLRDLSAMEGASEQLKADFKAAHEWMGVKEGEAPTREQLEKWAKGVELYFTEGKAPKPELRGVFQRIAVWMNSVYQKAKQQLGVEISPKIRDVFDRWFAATDAVERARDEFVQPFKSAEEAGWTEEQFQKYAENNNLALDKAKEEILAKLNEAAIRERSQQWKDDEKNVREAVTAQLDASPDFQAIATLRKGKMADGTPLTLNKDALVKQFGEERTKALLAQHMKIYREKGGVDADTAAEVLGFNSGEDLMAALEGAPNRKQAIEEYTRQEMIRQYGDIRFDGTLDDQARVAVNNDTQISNLHKELRAYEKLAQKASTEKKDAKKEARVAQEVPSIQSFRDAAKAMIEGKQIVDINPNAHLNAQRKFSREAYELGLKGDYEEARAAKQKELINQFLFTESLKAKAEVEKVYSYVKRLGTAGSREKIAKGGGELGQQKYLDQIDNILEQFQFSNESNKSIRERQSLQDFAAVKQQEALKEFLEVNPTWTTDHPGETPEIPSPVDTTMLGVSKNYRELTLPELRAVRDLLKNIEFLGKKEFNLIRDGKEVSLAAEVADFDRVARANNKTKIVPRSGTDFSAKEQALAWLHGADGFATKMEWLINQLDGGNINGPARRNIKKVIDDANGKWLEVGHDIYGKLETLLKARPKEDVKDIFESTGVQFPSSDRPLNRMQLISWALNLGTVENQKVALLGEGLIKGDSSVDPVYDAALKAIRPSEWRFIQGVWDTLESMRPEVEAKALRVNGVKPQMKTVTPFDVTASDGTVIHMRGGYYPLKGEYGDRVGNLQQDPAKQMSVGFSRPTTSTSHTKQVTGATYRLLLDYQNVLSQHLSDVIKDTTTGEAISEVYRFINNEQVKNTIQETLGPKEEREFLMWLQDFAGSGKGQQRGNDPILNALMSRRSGMVVARLGANFGSYAIQLGDVFKSIADPDIKTKYLAKAFLDIRRNPTDMIEWIREQSPNEMRFREENFQREIKEMITEKSVFDKNKQVVTEFLMKGFAVMDRFVTFPAWLARYRQGMSEHGDAKRAAMEADRTIARSYQAGDNRNMSRMMRTGGYIKLLTTFGGDANTWYGLISSSIRSGNPRVMSVAIMALVSEQIVGQYIKNRGMQEEDDKTTWLLSQTLNAFLGKIPVFGDVGEYAVNSAMGKYASLQNPTYQALESSGKAAKSLFSENKDAVEKAQDLTEATGIWMGIPGTSQGIRSWKYLYKVHTGEERPDNLYELGRNTIFGKAKK